MYMHKTGSYTFRQWKGTNSRSIQKYTSYKIILGSIPHRRLKASSRSSKKIARQLVGQSSSTPFMSIKYSHNKKVTFDTQDGLEDKTARLTVMMSKLAANNEETNKQFKTKIYQNKRRGKMRNFYDRHNYQNRYRSNSGDRRIQFSGKIQYGQNYRGRPRYGQSYRNDFRRGNCRGNMTAYQNQNCRRQNNRGGYRANYRNKNYEGGRSRSRERSYSHLEGMTEIVVIVGQGRDQEQVLIETELGGISVENIIIS